jgi:outer membrane protein assembly factor BamC
MTKSNFSRNLLLTLACLGLVGCGSWNVDEVLPDKRVEYQREQQAGRNLEIPPDLTSDRITDRMSVPDTFGAGGASYSEYVTDRRLRGAEGGAQTVAGAGVLPEIRGIEVRREGDERWLLVQAPVEDVWQRVADFWQQEGILMVEQDPTVGIMRTAWLENRAEISRDFVTNSIRRVFDGLYEAGVRDQYRVRLERVADGVTELYLTHYGMEEQVIQGTAGTTERTVWVPRERDPGLEVEMLHRIMIFLGSADERARAQLAAGGQGTEPRAQLLNTREGTRLVIDEEFGRAWRLVGLALDRVGFAVEDRDRSAGIYYVRYNDPTREEEDGGWLSRLKFWGSDEDVDRVNRYQVKVGGDARGTVVAVANEQGQPDNSPTAVRILTLLHEQIR